MYFNKSLQCLLIGSLALISALQASAQSNLHQYVDTRIGSEGVGRVFIGPSCPFGMVKPSPDCTVRPNSGWLPEPAPVTGFGQVHVSGTGGGPKYGNILIMPFTGALISLDHSSMRQDEKMTLGYYSVKLKKHNIKTEITTADKASFYKFTYPAKASKALAIDAGFFLGENPVPDAREAQQFVGSEIEVVSDTEVRGYSRIRGGWNNGAAYTVYFHAVFNTPVKSLSTWKGKKLFPGVKQQFDGAEKTGALLSFKDAGNDTLKVKIGISFVSEGKAKENVAQEIPHWSFDKVLGEVRQKWNNLLSRIEISADASVEQKKMFYTALYHTMLMPVNRTNENPLWSGSEPYYDDFYAIWDTFRSSNPLITLISPARQTEIVNALLNIYKHDGYMPDARSGNYNGRTQGGSNAEVLIADAFAKGLQGINYNVALEAMLKDATVPPGGLEEKEGRGGIPKYDRLGYVPYHIPRAGNRTTDYAYEDYCIAMVAKGMGKTAIYQKYIKLADNWKNLWRDGYKDHGATGFIMPKDSSGRWLDEIPYGTSKNQHPTFKYTPLSREYPWYVCHWCGFFYEATSWEYSLSIPHQVPQLVEKSGGKEAFKQRLDTLFEKRFYNVDNEPSFLTPSLYHWIGRPDLSSQRIRQIVTDNFNTSPTGLPGNDDSGAMSSWLAFQMMGFYPNAGQSYYLLNSPMLKQVTLHQENGKDFRITAKNLSAQNVYVKSVKLNGKDFDQAWIEHADIVKGGELTFEMTSKPTSWGTKVLPPSKN
ncbi:GH92 family glycosyl hydrolase [Mucilaginibacter terrae]|uniref:Alpha-1,2-mannosidase n=1 Tax=Mucilaginibacter terrae TaxID=1955052 RepID=A0ABU3GQT5_9SPHI|nr:GH92 family glycosyl hydrolase [Mucilaginibacter terrae]MDT3402152.1 putative alpha-1,2-mannosidase [Mucilaginibacter terrae]